MLDWGCQSTMGICALCYIQNLFGVMFCRDLCSIGLGVSICHGYICIVLCMKLIWCNGFPEIYAQLEKGMGSICNRYMCMVLYIYVTYLV